MHLRLGKLGVDNLSSPLAAGSYSGLSGVKKGKNDLQKAGHQPVDRASGDFTAESGQFRGHDSGSVSALRRLVTPIRSASSYSEAR